MRNVHTSFWVFILSIGSMVVSAVAKPNNNVLLLNPSVPVLDSLPALCQQAQPLNLLQFVRAGSGSFSGPGVVSGTFSPSLAGMGRHILSFTYFDSATQSNLILYPSITVRPLPNYTYTASGSCLGSMLNFTIADTALFFWDWKLNGNTIKRSYISYQWQAQLVTNQNLGLFAPEGMFLNSNGDIYVADTENHRVLRITPSGASFVVAGGNGAGPLLNQTMHPRGLFVDATGALYVSESGNNRVTKWLPGAAVGVVVAGAANGAAGTALNRLNSPKGIWVRPNGDLFIADMENHRVVRWANGATSGVRVAGTGIRGGGLNELNYPWALAMDTLGRLFVSDIDNRRVMRYDPNVSSGVVVAGGNGWGNALNQFTNPFGISVDRFGYLYVADYNSNRVMRFAPGSSDAEIIVGNGAANGSQGQLSGPITAFLDRNGSLVVLNRDLGVRRFLPEILTTDSLEALNNGVYEIQINSLNDECSFLSNSKSIFSPIVQLNSSAGYNVCEGDTTILSITPNSTFNFQWFKDNIAITGANTPALSVFQSGLYHVIVSDSNQCSTISEKFRLWPSPIANLSANGICVGTEITTNVPDSNVYQIDWYQNNQLIKRKNRKYQEEGLPVLGNFGGWINGLVLNSGITDFHIHTDGSIYLMDAGENKVIRYFPATGQYVTVAGGNGVGSGLNQFNNPQGIFVTEGGIIFIADMGNHRIVSWQVDANQGVVVAGATGVAGAALNRLNNPIDVAVDVLGNIFVADANNHRVVRWNSGANTGVVVAGVTGQSGSGNANLNFPTSLFLSKNGQLYITDNYNHRILRVNQGSTLAFVVAGGNGSGGGLNQLSFPSDVFVDDESNVYITDNQNHRVVRWSNGATVGELVAGGQGFGFALNQTITPWAIKMSRDHAIYIYHGGMRLSKFESIVLSADTLIASSGGNYSFSMHSIQGCQSFSTIRSIFAPEVRLSSTKGMNVCVGDTSLLTTPFFNSYTYQWFKNGAPILGALSHQINVFEPGVYYVEVTDSNACSTISESMRIQERPTFQVASSGLCLGSTLAMSSTDSDIVSVEWIQNGSVSKRLNPRFAEAAEVFSASNIDAFGMDQPFDIAVDHLGNIYYSEHANHRVVRRASDGSSPQVVAGNGILGDGLNQLNQPTGIFVDRDLNVYVADMGNHRVVKWSIGASQGVVVAGATGLAGTALSRLNNPMDVVVDDSGAVYVADRNNHRIVKWISNANSGTLFAGTGTAGSAINQLHEPYGLDIHNGAIYVADHWNGRAVRILGSTRTIVANALQGGDQRVSSVHVDKSGNVYLSETLNSRVVQWSPNAIAGVIVAGGNGNGGALNQLGQQIYGIVTDAKGNLYVSDGVWNQRILRYNRQPIAADTLMTNSVGQYKLAVTTVNGCVYESQSYSIFSPEVVLSSSQGWDVCEGDTTQLSTIHDSTYTFKWYKDGLQIAGAVASSLTAFEPGVYHVEVSDSNTCSRTSESMRIWPKPATTLTADGLCLGSQLTTNLPDSNVVQIDWFRNNQLVKQVSRKYLSEGEPVLGNYNGWLHNVTSHWGMWDFYIHSDSSIYYSDPHDRRIARFNPKTGLVQTVAGGNGPGAALNQLGDWAKQFYVMANGDVYVADEHNHRVVKWSPGASQGVVVAGTTGITGSGLNRLNFPADVVVDDSGSVYVADYGNHRVVKWAVGATIGTLVAGTTSQPGSGLNQLYHPTNLFLTNDAELYVTDRVNNRIMLYLSGSTTGWVVAGGNSSGSALHQLANPAGLYVDHNQSVYIADKNNHRVVRWRKDATQGELVAGGNGLGNDLNQTPFPLNLLKLPSNELFIMLDYSNFVGGGFYLSRFEQDEMPADTLLANQEGVYKFQMRTLNGCLGSSPSHAIFAPEVSLSSTRGFDICEGDTSQLSTIQDSTYTFKWYKDGIQIAGAVASSLTAFEPGVYHVEVSDSNACSRTSESMRIWPKPVTFLTTTGSCLGSELNINTADSDILEINWFRNDQLIRNKKAIFKATATPLVGNFQGSWLSNLEIQGMGGIGDVFVRNDSSIFILAQFAQLGICVVKLNPILNSFSIVAGGNGTGNGLDQLASFNLAGHASPGIYVTNDDAIYIADRGNHRVVKWLPGANTGVLVAGGTNGDSLNQLSDPKSVYVNDSGDIYIADRSNHRVVKWANGASSGVIVAGGNGQGTGLNQLNNPSYLTMDVNGNLYVSDRFNDRVMRYSSGTNIGVIVAGGNGAGPSLNQLNRPNGIAVDKLGNVYIADQFNNRVVRWAPGASLGGVVAGLNLGELVGLDRTVAPVALRLSENYELFVTCANPLSGGEPQRLIKFSLEKMLSDSIFAQQGGGYNVVSTNINNCTSSTQTVTIFDPTVSFPTFNNACVTASSIQLNMATPSGGTYFGSGVDTGYFHPNIAGVGIHKLYYLYTDSNGCSKLDSQTIQVVPEPVVSIDTLGSMDLCFGESVTLQSPLVSGQNYQWYRNGVLIPQATQRAYTVRDSVSAQYHVMVTRNICEKSSDTLAVIVRPKPVVTIGNLGATTICQGDSVILQASSDTDVSYQWYRNGQLLAGSTQSSLVANQTGNYICQVVKANGCADTSNTLSLTVLDYPIAQITPVNATTVCSGQAVILNANQGTGLTHRWFRNGVLIAGATSASYQATQSGDYTVEVKRQQLCATVSAPVTVVVNPLPQISIQVAQGGNFCSGDSIQINAQSTSQVLRYAWFRNGQLLPSDSTGTFFARLPGFYHARVFDTAGCDKASDSVQVGYFDPPFANENICAISVDTLTGRNVVVWEKTANVRTAAYNIYREGVVTGQYINIGRVPFDSMSTFTDTTANPLSQSFRYRIAVVDSCGFESARSVVHRTIHLSSNVGVNNEVNLFWTAYEGVPVPTHRILRSVNGAPFVQIAQVSGTTFTYTDLTPPQGAKNYLIEIEIPGGCSPTGLRTSGQRVSTNFSSIRSNRVAVGQGVFVRNVGWNEPSLYPNPSSGKLYLKLGAALSDRQFEVYDARGRLVRRITVESSEEPHEFDFSMEADGVYTIRSVNSEWRSRFVISK